MQRWLPPQEEPPGLTAGVTHCPLPQSRELQVPDPHSHPQHQYHIQARRQVCPWHPHSLPPILSPLLVFLAPVRASPFGFQCPPPSLGSRFRHGSWPCPWHSQGQAPGSTPPGLGHRVLSLPAQADQPIQTGARQRVSKLLPVVGLLQQGAAGLQLQ